MDVYVTSTLQLGPISKMDSMAGGTSFSSNNYKKTGLSRGQYALESSLHGSLALGASALCKIVLGVIVVSIFAWMFLYSRITAVQLELETRNQLLEAKIRYLLCRQENIAAAEPDCDNIISTTKSDALRTTTSSTDRNGHEFPGDNEIERNVNDEVFRVKRDLNSKVEPDAKLNQSAINFLTQSKINGHKKFRRSIRGKLVKTEKKVEALKRVLETQTKLSHIAYSNFNQRLANYESSRAAYLVVNGPEINVRTRGQLLGPWYIAKNGSELGFTDLDLWYGQHLQLNSNATSVIFKESGLFLIYAQVYYHVTLGIGEKARAMGFRITVKKNAINDSKIKRPIPIAECVPSHPTTAYQTCFTQAAWYIASGDEIYLEHHMSGLPMIESEKQGQSFLGIVKL